MKMNTFSNNRIFLVHFLGILMFSMLQAWAVEPSDNHVYTGQSNNPDFKARETLPCPVEGENIVTCVKNRIIYPQRAVDQKVEGIVIIEFTVDANGNISQTKIIKDIGGCCGMAAACAIKKMKFSPANQNGFPVACTMRISVRFELT